LLTIGLAASQCPGAALGEFPCREARAATAEPGQPKAPQPGWRASPRHREPHNGPPNCRQQAY